MWAMRSSSCGRFSPSRRLKIGPAVTETQEPYALAPDLKDSSNSAGVPSSRGMLDL